MNRFFRRSVIASVAAAVSLAWAPPSDARVTKIIIDRLATPLAGDATYETITGRAFGELDPMDSHNSLITDLALAPRNANGMVEYIASFFIVKPVNMSQSSGLMWHDVPNRGGRITISSDLRAQGDIGISSGWQGDNAGATAMPSNAASPTPVTPSNNEWVKTPVLTGTTGMILGRIVNRSGMNGQALNVMGNPIPYFPAADQSNATLTTHTNETVNGKITVGEVIPNSDWKFCGGGTFAAPLPVTALPVQLCLKNGFDATRLYQLVYNAKDPYVLGTGTAAFRDVASFFRYASEADGNMLAGKINKAIIRGSSQSGNFTRHLIFLGMNEDEAGRIVHDGAWPLIAGRRVANNSRWGMPDGVLELYQMGSEGPQWWHSFPDRTRNIHPGGILDRCNLTNTCPKIVETFGGAEVFALKMTPSWVGTDPKNDIPLPNNVRRYYLPSSTHGGGGGGFNEAIPNVGAGCPGNNWGTGTLRANPVPATQLVNRLRVALREWVLDGTEPPASKWPRMSGANAERTLVEANKTAMGFPSGVPGIPNSIFEPENFAFPIFGYDWGPDYDHFNASGVPTNVPPPIDSVVKVMVPKVDADGNELGGVPTVLRDAPLGTYLGWNITSGGFHAGQVCNYVGGMVPFAKTRVARLAAGDPRLSLEERYNNSHAGYVAAVKAAADKAACQGYLLAGPDAAAMGAKCTGPIPAGFPDDWAVLVNQAIASNVCNQPGDGGKCNPAAP
ncbi:MAG TPA: alpha/beta hydrolase domain-containing protein [Bradyrhizobium sp.]|jgi:alpha/beta hydrolase family protein|nr:alpha/beta hydrolase domain-containing protein [Bradyrhizobium sp.]